MTTAPRPPLQTGYSGMTLLFTSIATLMLGIIIGVGVMWLGAPMSGTATSETTSADASAAPPEPTATASATATAKAQPKIDPAAAAAAKKLAELQKKVKRTRSKQIDPECAKYHGKKLPAGYVFDGGKFEENKYVANASGCLPIASAAKAPWFCCAR